MWNGIWNVEWSKEWSMEWNVEWSKEWNIGHQTLATRERKRVEILLDSVLWE